MSENTNKASLLLLMFGLLFIKIFMNKQLHSVAPRLSSGTCAYVEAHVNMHRNLKSQTQL